MQTLGIAHLADYVHGQRAHRFEYRGGQYVAVARDHAHGYRLAYGAPHAQHYRRDYAAPRGGHQHAEHRLLLSRAQRRRALVIAARQGAQCVFAYRNYRGQNHERQHDRRGQDAIAIAGAVVCDKRHDDHHAEKAIYYGRYARQQLYALIDDAIYAPGAKVSHEYRRAQSRRYAQYERAARYVQTADYHVEYAELLRVVIGLPRRTAQEVPQSNLADGGPCAPEYEHAYAPHRRKRYQRRYEKPRPRRVFLCARAACTLFHRIISSLSGRFFTFSLLRRYCILTRFAV